MSQTRRSLAIERDGLGNETHAEVSDVPQDSIELSVNAKGEPSWSVKVYAHDPVEGASRLEAMRKLAERHATEIRAGKGASQ